MKFASSAIATLLLATTSHGTQIATDRHAEDSAAAKLKQVKNWIQDKMEQDKAPNMAELEQAASDMSTRSAAASLVSLRGSPDELVPVGEGAYQSAEAVKQRTVDSRNACEKSEIYKQSHWEECFKSKGDFVDGPHHGYEEASAPVHSGAASHSTVAAMLLALLA